VFTSKTVWFGLTSRVAARIGAIRCSGGIGRGRNSTLFATLNMAVVAPMPRAMISNAVAVRVGV
jgi:hypothetical protein